MNVAELVALLDHPESAREKLVGWRLAHPAAAHANLVSLAQSGVPLDLLASLCQKLTEYLPQADAPDRLLAELRRFFESSRSPLSLASLLDRDAVAATTLLQVLDLGKRWADVLVADPEAFDLLCLTQGQPSSSEILVAEVEKEIALLTDEHEIVAALARIRQREWLRVAYGLVFRGLPMDVAGEQLSIAAGALLEAAMQAARRKQDELRPVQPQRASGKPARLAVVGLGRLGGQALDFHEPLEVMFISDTLGGDPAKQSAAAEYLERVTRQMVRFLTEHTLTGPVCSLAPHVLPNEGPEQLVCAFDDALYHYDVLGRTWERRQFLSARAVAGDLALGEEFLRSLDPWLFRRYLQRADETGIKALRRRILRRLAHDAETPVGSAAVGYAARLIEEVVQFLQLLSGGELSEIHSGRTLVALTALGQAGVLDPDENRVLDQAYRTFRGVEQISQILLGPAPSESPSLSWLAVSRWATRSGLIPPDVSLDQRMGELREALGQVVRRLIGGMFASDPPVTPLTDLILDPDPLPQAPRELLAPMGFTEPSDAYASLQSLATEKIAFLSPRRCRHFLAAIAPQLVEAIAATPAPDATLTELSRVSDSLGGKGVLWELFSFHRASLELYVRLCGASPYLSGILTSNPGMIDELLDSLLLERLPQLSQLQNVLDNLCRGISDTLPTLVGFKQSQHLRVGVRDLLGKDDINSTLRSLSDVAEVCLARVAAEQQERLATKFGVPSHGEGEREGEPCEFLMVALGKLGGQEPNYHSDLNAIFLYEADGQTQFPERSRRGTPTTNAHFFNQLAQRVVSVVNQLGPQGRLYELGTNLRPHGKLGPLAVSCDEFFRYLESAECRVFQRQTLLRARPITGSPAFQARFLARFRETLANLPLPTNWLSEIYSARLKLEQGAKDGNLKRGVGGTLDIEQLVQTLQLEHCQRPEVVVPGTLAAIAELRRIDALSAVEASYLQESYQFLRRVESAIRLMNRTARHDLPDDEAGKGRLAMLLREPNPQRLLAACEHYRRENRQLFDRFFAHRGVASVG